MRRTLPITRPAPSDLPLQNDPMAGSGALVCSWCAMQFQTATSDAFNCNRCGHSQSYFPIKEAVEGGEPCNRCRAKTKETAKTVRWCRTGDTISTVRPMSEHDGLRPNQHLHAILNTPESCAEANDLVAAGRWRVSRCGKCQTTVEECRCHGIVTLPALAADIGRCNGHIYANGREVCPQREKCIRFLVPPVKDHPRQAWLFVAGSDQIGNCTEFWST